MNSKFALPVLIGIIILQLSLVFGLLFWNQAILSGGTAVKIRSPQPVDPSSLFRGNYIALRYTISDIDLSKVNFPQDAKFKRNDRVWVILEKEENSEWWEAVAVSREKPKLSSGQHALRGKVKYAPLGSGPIPLTQGAGSGSLAVDYGVEQYFIPQEFEDEATKFVSLGRPREGRLAVVGAEVMVHSSGRARVREVYIGGVALSDLLSGKAAEADIKTEVVPSPSPWPQTQGTLPPQNLLPPSGTAPQPPGAGTHYLSDLSWFQIKNGWGPVEKDTSIGETGFGDGRTITINGKTYQKGLGVHANSEIQLYLLGSQCHTFSSDIGVDDESTAPEASVTFEVWGDNQRLYVSPTLRALDNPVSVSLNVSGKGLLKLVVTDAGDGINFDHADWASAQLSCNEPDFKP